MFHGPLCQGSDPRRSFRSESSLANGISPDGHLNVAEINTVEIGEP